MPAHYPTSRIQVDLPQVRSRYWVDRIKEAYAQALSTGDFGHPGFSDFDTPYSGDKGLLQILSQDDTASVFPGTEDLLYLCWLARGGHVDPSLAADRLGSVSGSSAQVSTLVDGFATLWDRFTSAAIMRLYYERRLLTPVVNHIFTIRQVLDRALSGLRPAGSSRLPLSEPLLEVEAALRSWISAQDSAEAFTPLKPRRPRGPLWSNALVMEATPLVASVEGFVSLGEFLEAGGAEASLKNPALSLEVLPLLRAYAVQSMLTSAPTEFSPYIVSLLDALRQRGEGLRPYDLDCIKLHCSTRGVSPDQGSNLSRVREVCADAALNRFLWVGNGSQLAIFASSAGPLWIRALRDFGWGSSGDSSTFGPSDASRAILLAISRTASWQLEGVTRGSLAPLMSHADPEFRSAILGVMSRLPDPRAPHPASAKSSPAI